MSDAIRAGRVWGCFEGERLVGITAAGQPHGPIWVLNLIGILPDARGAGHGAALLDAVYCAARSAGAEALRLTTTVKMEALVAFYVRQGFSATHVAYPSHRRDRHLRIFMKRPL
ncbi:MAG: GNAT family N-acetyltransferase [Pseudomonadota bacterium]